jgi:hypothetical protein
MPSFDPFGLLTSAAGMRQSSELVGNNVLKGVLAGEQLAASRQRREHDQQRYDREVEQYTQAQIKAGNLRDLNTRFTSFMAENGGQMPPEEWVHAQMQNYPGLNITDAADYMNLTESEAEGLEREIEGKLTQAKLAASKALTGEREARTKKLEAETEALGLPPATGNWHVIKGTNFQHNRKNGEIRLMTLGGEQIHAPSGVGGRRSISDLVSLYRAMLPEEKSVMEVFLEQQLKEKGVDMGGGTVLQESDRKRRVELSRLLMGVIQEELTKMGGNLDLGSLGGETPSRPFGSGAQGGSQGRLVQSESGEFIYQR